MRFRAAWLLVAVSLALSACTSSGSHSKTDGNWFQARPLIMPGRHTTTVRTAPFASLRVPTSESGYYRLSGRQQAQLASALRAVDCAHPPRLAGSVDRVVCDADSDAFLVGAPIFTGNDVTKASPLPPSASIADWQISLTLTGTATDTVYRWTTRHHLQQQTGAFNDVQTSSKPPCGLALITQCSDFIVYVGDGRALSVPATYAAVRSLVIPGTFDERLATRLADRLES